MSIEKVSEMTYGPKFKMSILAFGNYKGYQLAVLCMGWHPCAYVKVPKDHPIYSEDYDEMQIFYNELTYGRHYLKLVEDETEDIWIGWDHGHCCDYSGGNPECTVGWDGEPLKKWTTDEMIEECKQAIDVLVKEKEKNDDQANVCLRYDICPTGEECGVKAF